MYTTPLGDVGRKHRLKNHLYAADSQLYVAFKPKDTSVNDVIVQVEDCVTEVRSWMLQNRLKLNDDKTELIVFSPKHYSHLSQSIRVKVGDAMVTPSTVVRDLGVFLDHRLSMSDG